MSNTGYLKQSEYEERVLQIKRVSKKTNGGNSIKFTALVVVGNKKGTVGYGMGKAVDVPSAIQKGIKAAKANTININLAGSTIPHEINAKYNSAKVMLKPAPVGSGIIAGGVVRHVVELAGITDISSKMHGSNNKVCNVICSLDALSKLKPIVVVEQKGSNESK
ncbi:MAG: 30S ribosomal protein S5 [Patescibacteria group bacterium]|uniref:Small ribosomal subunit protein uS5 n=1 Tax=candidate division WWE3 bacterium TaxID=2053526 RepID=A0A955EFV4_UNCKA|nr:30S ribosomal protein S5 [candidate division WWE3 bacterium]